MFPFQFPDAADRAANFGIGNALAKERVLVTGSSGFIGSHVFSRFRHMGWDVRGIGRRRMDVAGYTACDLTRPLRDQDHPAVDVVIHGAARSSPWGSRREFEQQNVVATQNVIDYCNRTGRPRLVYISSSSVYYQACHQFGITEETVFPKLAVNLYAQTKLLGEDLVRAYEGEWVILRPRAVFGPGDTVLLPRIVKAASAGRLPVLVPEGEPVVGDLIYIDNLVDYIVRAGVDRRISGSFNLTNNQPVEILGFLFDLFGKLGIPIPQRRVKVKTAMALAGLLEAFYGVCMPWREPPITRFGVHVFAYSKTFNVSRAIAAMGPVRVPIDQGLERTVAWIRQGGGACPMQFSKV